MSAFENHNNTPKTLYDQAMEQMDDSSREVLDSSVPETQEVLPETAKQKGGKIAKTIGLGAMTAQMMMSSLDAQAADNTAAVEDANSFATEISAETSFDNTDDAANFMDYVPGNEPENDSVKKTKVETEPTEPTEPEKNPDSEKVKFEDAKESVVTIENDVADITTFFPESDAGLTPKGIEAVQKTLRSLFDNATPEQLEGLKDGTMKVVLRSESSQTTVREGGSPQKDGSLLMNNYEFSRARGENTFDVSQSVFEEYGIENAIREIEIAQEDGYELGTTSANERMVQLSIELADAAKAVETSTIESLPENLKKYENVIYKIVDESPSMKSEADLARADIKKLQEEFGSSLKYVKLEAGKSGGAEAHKQTLDQIYNDITLERGDNAYETTKIIQLDTDEPSVESSKALLPGERGEQAAKDYEAALQETIDKFKKLNIQIDLTAYEPGNTLASITKILEAGDLTRTERDSQDQGWYENLKNNAQQFDTDIAEAGK